jgi:hypothetical protein
MLRTLLFFITAVAFAQGPFDGTWRVDLQKVEFSQKPDKWELVNGTYSCSTCVPKINIKADGTDQKVAGARSYDTESVKVIDDRTVQFTEKKGGKITSESKETVDPDGSRLTVQGTDYPENGSQPVTLTLVGSRVEKGTAGSHAISGAWQVKSLNASDNALTLTFKSTGDGLSMTSPTGSSFTAKFDGKDYPYKGAPTVDTISLKRIDANTFEESEKRDGKVVNVTRFTVSADGRSMNVVAESKLQGRTTKFVVTKQ